MRLKQQEEWHVLELRVVRYHWLAKQIGHSGTRANVNIRGSCNSTSSYDLQCMPVEILFVYPAAQGNFELCCSCPLCGLTDEYTHRILESDQTQSLIFQDILSFDLSNKPMGELSGRILKFLVGARRVP